ncbi:MAG: hypothetical protein M1816_007788 [Peltula sp. TS41687]|nr:MAG: hypothetical protein M1816_007788 [Peltula sp. TS41687]
MAMMKGSSGEQEVDAVDISAGQRMLSAVTGSLLTSLLVTPLDVVRVRLQSQPSIPPSASPLTPWSTKSSPATSFTNLPPNLGVSSCCREVFWVNNNASFCVASPTNLQLTASTISPSTSSAQMECAAEEAQRRTFTSTLDGLRKIARHEGLGTLWRGLSPTLVMAVPANVIYFTGYDWLRYNARSPIAKHLPDTYVPLIAGSFARITAATVISPIEMFRTRLQATSTNSRVESAGTRSLYMDTLKGLKDMAQLQGFSSLWRGLSLTLWRDVPFSGLYWWGYETLHETFKEARGQRNETIPAEGRSRTRSRSRSREKTTTTLTDSFLAGAISGGIAAIVTTPFDVGKTRQQVSLHAGDSSMVTNSTAGALAPEEQSMPRFLWHIFKTEGVAGLWKGWAARCLKVAPACAIMISSYEVGKKMARGMNERKMD